MKPKRPQPPVPPRAGSSRSRPADSPAPSRALVRRSLRLLGLLLALAPWVLAPAAFSLDSLDELKSLFVAAGLTLCLFLLLGEERRRPSPPITLSRFLSEPFHAGAILALAGLTLSALFSPVPGLGLLAALPNLLFIFFALCLALRPPAPAELRWLLLCLFSVMILQALLALAQYFFPRAVELLLPFAVPARAGRDSMIGTLGNPEYLAGWLAAGLAAAVLILWRGPGARDSAARDPLWLAAVVLAALAISVIFIGGSRGALLATLGALALTVVAGRAQGTHLSWQRHPAADSLAPPAHDLEARPPSPAHLPAAPTHIPPPAPPPRRRRTAILVAAGSLLGLLFLIWAFQTPTLRHNTLPGRLADLANLHSPSVRHRLGLLAVTSNIIREHPLLGVGPGRFGWAYGETQARLASRESGIGYWALGEILTGNYVGEVHCDPLQWWAEYGLLPLLGLTLMIARVLAGAAAVLRRGTSSQPLAAAAWAALAALSLDMWVAFPLQRPIRALTFWVLLGLLAGLLREAKKSDRG